MWPVPACSSSKSTGSTERVIDSGLALRAPIDRRPTPDSARARDAMTWLQNRAGSASFASRLTQANLVPVEAAVPAHSVSTVVLPNPAGAERRVRPRSRPDVQETEQLRPADPARGQPVRDELGRDDAHLELVGHSAVGG